MKVNGKGRLVQISRDAHCIKSGYDIMGFNR